MLYADRKGQVVDRNPTLKRFGDKLVELREARGWNQRDLAKRLKKTPAFVYRVENGESWVSVETLIDIADLFEVDLSDLFKLGRVHLKAPKREMCLAEALDVISSNWEEILIKEKPAKRKSKTG